MLGKGKEGKERVEGEGSETNAKVRTKRRENLMGKLRKCKWIMEKVKKVKGE